MALGHRRRQPAGARTGLSWEELEAYTDALVGNPSAIWRLIGCDPSDLSRGAVPPSPEAIYRGILILEDACDRELMLAPPLRDYIWAGANGALGVAGVAICFAGPILGSVVAGMSLAIGAAAGAAAFIQGGSLIRKDVNVGERLHAIEQALEILHRSIP